MLFNNYVITFLIVFFINPSSTQKYIQLGEFSRLGHNLSSGPIKVINNKTFYIPNLYYDGRGPDAHFWAGKGSAGPNEHGFLVPNENGSRANLRKYNGENITVTLPNNVTINDIDYFGVWCIAYRQNFGYVNIREEEKYIQLGEFSRLAHNLSSGPIKVINNKKFYIPNLYYDGRGPDAHFWAGKGHAGPNEHGFLVPNENGSRENLRKYNGENINVTLPNNVTINDIDYFGVWCIAYRQNFGYVNIREEEMKHRNGKQFRSSGENYGATLMPFLILKAVLLIVKFTFY